MIVSFIRGISICATLLSEHLHPVFLIVNQTQHSKTTNFYLLRNAQICLPVLTNYIQNNNQGDPRTMIQPISSFPNTEWNSCYAVKPLRFRYQKYKNKILLYRCRCTKFGGAAVTADTITKYLTPDNLDYVTRYELTQHNDLAASAVNSFSVTVGAIECCDNY